MVIHTYPGQKNTAYTPLLGDASKYAGTSFQTNNADFVNEFREINGAPFRAMSNANALVSGADNNANRCLASPGSHYGVQLYCGDGGGTTSLDLTDAAGDFQVRWFDPRNGGAMQQGSR